MCSLRGYFVFLWVDGILGGCGVFVENFFLLEMGGDNGRLGILNFVLNIWFFRYLGVLVVEF